MSLVSPDKFQHILRVQNTNIDGKFSLCYGNIPLPKLINFIEINSEFFNYNHFNPRLPQHHVRHDCHPWYWSSFLQPDLQKG